MLITLCVVVVLGLAVGSVYAATAVGVRPPLWALAFTAVPPAAAVLAMIFGGWWSILPVVTGGIFLWLLLVEAPGARRPRTARALAGAVAVICIAVAVVGWFWPISPATAAAEYVPAGSYPAAYFAPPDGGDQDSLYFKGDPVEVLPGGVKLDGDVVVVEGKGLRYR